MSPVRIRYPAPHPPIGPVDCEHRSMPAASRADGRHEIHHSGGGKQGGFNWLSQHLVMKEVMMGVVKGREAVRALRPAMRSPGRPPVGRREHRERFWEGIAGGLSSEDAGVAAGVSPAVGSRWFREYGGMAPFVFVSVSGRYLSFGRSHVSCAATLQPVAEGLSIGPRLRSGIRIGGPAARRSRSSLRTTPCATTWRIVWVGRSPARMASWCRDPRCVGSVAVTGPERIGGWSPEQISNRLRVDFPHNEQCEFLDLPGALCARRGALKRARGVSLASPQGTDPAAGPQVVTDHDQNAPPRRPGSARPLGTT